MMRIYFQGLAHCRFLSHHHCRGVSSFTQCAVDYGMDSCDENLQNSNSPCPSSLSGYQTSSAPQPSCLQHPYKDWNDARRHKLTASTFSHALGFWPKRRIQLWLEKIGAIDSFSGNLATRWDNIKEKEEALERYHVITGGGRNVLRLEFLQVYGGRQENWLAASPDGITDEFIYGFAPSRGVLEIKCPISGDPWKRIPLYYIPQAQGLMEIMNREWMDFYVWTVNGSSLFRIHRDVQYWNLLKMALSDFWWKHVQPARELCSNFVITDPLNELKSLKPAPRHEQWRSIICETKRVANNYSELLAIYSECMLNRVLVKIDIGAVYSVEVRFNSSKIDIGAVYSVEPAKKNAYALGGGSVFTPVARELVFDIDISDYDDVRYCCKGADVCLDCWPLMTVAIKVIDHSLRDDFGFNHILWVFSGRRGVHCWVCDGKARRLTDEQRAAIADYFRVYKGNENSNKKVSLPGPLHPFLITAYEKFLEGFFESKLLSSQKLLSTEENYEKILEMIPDSSVASELRGKWQENRRSSTCKDDIDIVRWKQLKHTLQSGKQKAHVRRCVEEIVFAFTYPRLDMEVSKKMGHLLKAPFCVHPATGRVCVPIDPKRCDEFDPTTVPTLSQLLRELNMAGPREDVGNELDRTTLRDSVKFFKSSFLDPLLKSCKDEIVSSYSAKTKQSKNPLSW